MPVLLALEDVDARYGQVQALRGVSLTVEEGEIAALLGANGAGKTTTLRAISGTVRRDGDISFAGKRLGRVGPDAAARLGIAHVPEGRGTFAELTVWENLRLGAYTRRASKDDFARVQQYFPWIDERRSQQAGTLSGGEQQMLALARAFMARPRLLLLDEPSLGLAAIGAFLIVGSLVSDIFAQQTVAGLSQGAIFASLALALVLIYRATEVINFAQGEMAMATTYMAYQLTLWHVTYWLAFFLTLVIAFVFGVVVQLVFIRPVQHRSVIAVVIITVGLFILIDGLVVWKWGADLKFMPAPFGNAVYHVGSVSFSRQDVGTLLVSLVSVLLLWLLFQ